MFSIYTCTWACCCIFISCNTYQLVNPKCNQNIMNQIISHQSDDGTKRQKLSDGSAATVANVSQLGGIRRSTRHRKLRGEKALIVSANQTLKELKIQVGAGAQPVNNQAQQEKLFQLVSISYCRLCTPSLWRRLTRTSPSTAKV